MNFEMKQRKSLTITAAAIGSLIIGLVAGRYLFPAAGSHDHPAGTKATDTASGEAATQATIWTCSMHPQIRQPEPGQCPICGMDLIPLVEDGGNDLGPRTLSMSESSRALARIQTSPVEKDYPVATVRIVGRLDIDETREQSLSARFPARIDRLYVNFNGIKVEKGEHLAEVYSPELLTAQRELITAYRNDPDSAITQAAREKLRLWDLLPEQIEGILESGKATDRFELRAPTGGVVVSKNVKEGDYVKTGQPLFSIVDLGVLWLNLEAYESDLQMLRYGQPVDFTVEAYPGETFSGKIAFIDPELDPKTRTIPVRVNIPNPDGRLKPGMFARGEVKVRIAEGGKIFAPELAGKWISPMHPEIIKDHPGTCDICGMPLVPAESLGMVGDKEEAAPITVPASAVLRTGKRAVVYVRVPDTERPTYEGREIRIGPRAGDRYVVVEGLQPGEEVVTNGAFKIDSALQIQAKPSMMNPEGGGPAPGHNHGSQSSTTDSGHQAALPALDPETAAAILPSYLELQAALAGDNLEDAQAALRSMMGKTGHSGPLPDLIHSMLAAQDIAGVRLPGFEQISSVLIRSIQENPDAFGGQLLLMHCPMADDNRGADWIQSGEPLQNPYFGSMMLTCGEIRGDLTATDTPDEDAGHAH